MRTLLVLSMVLSACAHETTTMDRELALKLADRPAVQVIQSAPPVVNVNVTNNTGATHSSQRQDDNWDRAQNQVPNVAQVCKDVPNYDSNYQISGYTKQCF